MKTNGQCTKREEHTVLRALKIMEGWVRAHANDERRSYGWDAIALCVHQLRADAWAMLDAT